MERLDGERGQTSASYLGTIVFAAVVIATLVLSAPGIGQGVVDGIRSAICAITGSGCSTETAAGEPSAPCVQSSGTGRLGFRVETPVVSVERGGAYLTERLSDGRIAVTYSDDAALAAGVGAGAYGWVKWGDGGASAGALAGAEAGVFLESGTTWFFDSEEAAEEFKDWHRANDAPNTFLPPGADQVYDAGHWIFDRIDDAIGEDAYRPPDRTITHHEGGLRLTGFAGFAGDGTAATVSALAEGAVGYQHNHESGETTAYVRVEGSAAGELRSLLGGAEGTASGEALVAVTFAGDGTPIRLGVRGATVYAGELEQEAGDLEEALERVTRASIDPSDPEATVVQIGAELDLTDRRNRQAFDAFATSLVRRDVPRLVVSGTRLFDRFREDGTITMLQFRQDGREYGAGGSLAVGPRGGGGAASLAFTEDALVDARYFDGDHGGFRPWTGCLGG